MQRDQNNQNLRVKRAPAGSEDHKNFQHQIASTNASKITNINLKISNIKLFPRNYGCRNKWRTFPCNK